MPPFFLISFISPFHSAYVQFRKRANRPVLSLANAFQYSQCSNCVFQWTHPSATELHQAERKGAIRYKRHGIVRSQPSDSTQESAQNTHWMYRVTIIAKSVFCTLSETDCSRLRRQGPLCMYILLLIAISSQTHIGSENPKG